jgi:tight adherence protein C
MIFLYMLLLFEVVLVLSLRLLAGGRYASLVKECGKEASPAFLAPVSLAWIDRIGLETRLPAYMTKLNHKMAALHGSKNAYNLARLHAARIVSVMIIALVLATSAALLAGGDEAILLSGAACLLLLPYLLNKELDKKIRRRHTEILLELPEFMNKLILLVGAGETVREAIIRSVDQRKDPQSNALYKEK